MKAQSAKAALVQQVVSFTRRCFDKGYFNTFRGEISIKSEGYFIVNRPEIPRFDITEQDVSTFDIYTGEILENGIRFPVNVHRVIYEIRSDIECVFYAPLASLPFLSSETGEIQTAFTEETSVMLKNIKRIPYQKSYSLSLAETVREACVDTDIIIIDNLGVVVLGPSPAVAYYKLELLDAVAKLNIFNRGGVLPKLRFIKTK